MIRISVLLLALLLAFPLFAQTPLAAPMVAGCPSPTPVGTTNWPSATCKYQFYPLTDTTHAIASASKSTPLYLHTYPGYAQLPSALLVACPAGALLSADAKICSNNGADASQLVAYPKVATLRITPVVVTQDYPVSWAASFDGYLVQHSADGGLTWDVGQTFPVSQLQLTYQGLRTDVTHCFQVTAVSKAWGNSAVGKACAAPGSLTAVTVK